MLQAYQTDFSMSESSRAIFSFNLSSFCGRRPFSRAPSLLNNSSTDQLIYDLLDILSAQQVLIFPVKLFWLPSRLMRSLTICEEKRIQLAFSASPLLLVKEVIFIFIS